MYDDIAPAYITFTHLRRKPSPACRYDTEIAMAFIVPNRIAMIPTP